MKVVLKMVEASALTSLPSYVARSWMKGNFHVQF